VGEGSKASMTSETKSSAVANERMFRSISYGLVFLMIVCIILAINSFIRNAIPGWASGVIAGVMIFILTDRLFTYQRYKSLTPLSSEWALTLGTQWIVILVFIRLLLSYTNGLDVFVRELSHFVHGNILEFFSPEFVVTSLLAILAWYLPTRFLELLDEIGLDQVLALREDSAPIESNPVPAHQRLLNLTFGLGIFLVILTALTRINLPAIFDNPDGLPLVDLNRFSAGEAGALLYFILGLALLSQSRLMSLQTHWNQQRIPVSSNNLVRQWGVYSLVFLLLLVLIVGLLPTGHSFGLFSILSTLFIFMINLLFFIGQLFIALITILFSLPFLLFGKKLPFAFRFSTLPAFPNPPVEAPLPTSSNAIWALVRSILLWGSLILIIIYSLTRFLRQHDNLLGALRKARIINWLIFAWQWLRRNVDGTWDDLSRVIADGWQSIVSRLEGKRILPRPGWISFRSLDPRRRIYFFYLAMVRRGGEQGLGRKLSQTPSEYAETLEKDLPSAGEDIDSITKAFVEARYSRHEINSQAADTVKTIWGRVRQALQNKSKSGQSANK
jgi:Domain of unknown function (DUF4129)